MQLEFINLDEVFGNLREVTSSRVFYRCRFDPNGIFSEQIFGPVEDFKCQCGFLQGREFAGMECPKCHVVVGLSKLRSTTFAKIQMPQISPDYVLKLINPLVMITYQKKIQNVTKKVKVSLLNVATGNVAAIINERGQIVKKDFEEGGQIGPNFIELQVIPHIRSLTKETARITDSFEQYLFTSVIPVLPPNTRPISKIGSTKSDYQISSINKYYMKILRIIEQIKQSPYIFDVVLAALQKEFNDLVNEILTNFSKKKGFLRKHILGKRVDYSGRAVIAVDPTINLDECKVPLEIAKEIFKPNIIKEVARRLNMTELDVIQEYDTPLVTETTHKLLRENFRQKYVILNRQPTLHRHSIEAFKITDIIKDDVIKIHPLITDPYNADFDGDQMALYIPHLNESINECREKLAPVENIKLPSNGALAYIPKQDIVLGLSILSDPTYTNKTTYLDQETTEGRVKIMQILPKYLQRDPELFGIINKQLVLRDIEKFLVVVHAKALPHEWIEVINKLTKLGIEYGKVTISLGDFILSDKDKINLVNGRTDELTPNNAVKMIKSGARGKWSQYIQTTVAKGIINDVTNVIVGKINKPLIDGLSREEFFKSAYGGRKGLIDTAENTAKAGYFTRKLVYLSSSTMLDPTVDDCHTDKTIEIFVSEQIAPLIIGRYYLDDNNELQLIKTKEQVLGKTIRLRSPITCALKGRKVCRKCYGNLNHRSKMIGMIAAQSLGERATQLTLRTKHTSGAGAVIPVEAYNHIEMKQNMIYAKTDGTLKRLKQKTQIIFKDGYVLQITDYGNFVGAVDTEFKAGSLIGILQSRDIVSAISLIEKLLNKPPTNISINDFINEILKIYGDYAKIYLVHFEVILQAMVRDKSNIAILYKNSPNNEYTIIGLDSAINQHPEQSLTFERFKVKLQRYIIRDTIPNVDDPSLLKMVAFFDFDETPVE